LTPRSARRILGEGLTRAAEALALGTDDAHVRHVARHLAHAFDASSVVILAVLGEGDPPHLLADSHDDRTEGELAALLGSTAVRECIVTGDVVVGPEKRGHVGLHGHALPPSAPEGLGAVASSAGGSGGRVDRDPDAPPPAASGSGGRAAVGTWVVFPILVHGRPRGALVACFNPLPAEEEELVFEIGRAAAALLAVVLPAARVIEPVHERTRRITLTDLHRERRVRAIERYRAFIDSASDGIVVLDPAGVILYMNRAAEQVTGYARDGMIGRRLAEMVPASERTSLERQVALATDSKPVENFDLALNTTSEEPLTVSVASIGILGDHGAAIFAFRDVTVTRALERELRRTTDFLERILNSAVDGIIAADLRGTVLLFNHSAERICGYRATDVIGKMSVKQLYPPGVAQEIMRLLRQSNPGRGGRLEPVRRDLQSVTGERIPVSISAALVVDDAGREIATVGIFSDLRERLRMEERLASAQEKLAISEKQVVAIELAGAAAHELNQPLTSVMGYAQMMLRKLETESPHHRLVETILAESERMAAIVRQLGSLTRYETKTYVGGAQIIDLDRSAPKKPD
jgi:PAS domain S-box-containing protein